MTDKDPLESAKITDDKPRKSKFGRRKGKSNDEPRDERVLESAEMEPAKTQDTAPRPSTTSYAPKRYKVAKRCQFSWNGAITTLDEGAVISAQQYRGERGIGLLRECGVELEEI